MREQLWKIPDFLPYLNQYNTARSRVRNSEHGSLPPERSGALFRRRFGASLSGRQSRGHDRDLRPLLSAGHECGTSYASLMWPKQTMSFKSSLPDFLRKPIFLTAAKGNFGTWLLQY